MGEIKEKATKRKMKSSWEKKRKEFYESGGKNFEEMEERGDEQEKWYKKMQQKEIEEQRKERWDKISELCYNRWCKMIKAKGISGYLKHWCERR